MRECFREILGMPGGLQFHSYANLFSQSAQESENAHFQLFELGFVGWGAQEEDLFVRASLEHHFEVGDCGGVGLRGDCKQENAFLYDWRRRRGGSEGAAAPLAARRCGYLVQSDGFAGRDFGVHV